METNQKDFSEISSAGKKVTTAAKFSIGSTRISANLINLIGSMYYLNHFVFTLGLDPNLFIIANVIYLFWNTLNDLIFGIYADRTTHKLGRRIPYIRYGSPLIFISFLFLWLPIPGLDSGIFLFLKFLLGIMCLDSAMTIVELSLGSLYLEITDNNDERNNINLYNTIFYAIGGLGTFLIPTFFEQGGVVLLVYIVISGGIASLIFYISSYLVKERKELHNTLPKPLTKNELILEIKNAFKNKVFISSLIFNIAAGFLLSNYTINSKLIGYIFGEQNFEMIVMTSVYGPAYIGYFVFKNKAKTIGSEEVIKKVTKFSIITILLLFFLDLFLNTIIDLSFVYIGILWCNGLLFGLSIFGLAFNGDALDYEELISNERKESMYIASSALIIVPIPQVVTILSTALLMMFSFHFKDEALLIYQPPIAIFGIKVIISFIPILMGLLYLLSLEINPLKGENYVKFKQDILKLHEEKEVIFKEKNLKTQDLEVKNLEVKNLEVKDLEVKDLEVKDLE
ncbi:MAG: hypothetical protein GY870_02995 [archaeon]|nr:hypothetical protein [archaeon]